MGIGLFGDNMIKITVEMLPFGFEEKKKLMCSMLIWNDLTSSKRTIGNYKYELRGKKGRVWRKGNANGFKRKLHGVWYLIGLVLLDCLGKRLVRMYNEEK